MHVSKLVGKIVLRTGPMRGENGGAIDYSYTTTPLLIKKVTEHHIYAEGKEIYQKDIILNVRWLDDQWVEYEGCTGVKYNN